MVAQYQRRSRGLRRRKKRGKEGGKAVVARRNTQEVEGARNVTRLRGTRKKSTAGKEKGPYSRGREGGPAVKGGGGELAKRKGPRCEGGIPRSCCFGKSRKGRYDASEAWGKGGGGLCRGRMRKQKGANSRRESTEKEPRLLS